MRKKSYLMSAVLIIGILSFGQIAQVSAYSGTAAAEYAIEWAEKYNTSKYYKADLDCTNFVSQCLEAGGKKRTAKNAQYDDIAAWRPHLGTWENANMFKKHWKNKGIDVNSYKIQNVYSLSKKLYSKYWSGDIMQYSDNDDESKHSQIVIGQTMYEGHSTLVLAQHTNGRRDIKLLEYLKTTGYSKVKPFKFAC